ARIASCGGPGTRQTSQLSETASLSAPGVDTCTVGANGVVGGPIAVTSFCTQARSEPPTAGAVHGSCAGPSAVPSMPPPPGTCQARPSPLALGSAAGAAIVVAAANADGDARASAATNRATPSATRTPRSRRGRSDI